MDDLNLVSKLGRNPDCPSEINLDRFHFGELPAEENNRIKEHLATCLECRQRLTLREKGFDAFTELDRQTMRHKIEAACRPEEKSSPGLLTFNWLRWEIAIAATAVLILFVTIGLAVWHEPGQDQLRTKGTLQLSIYREHKGRVEQVVNGDVFNPGDRLRFEVDLVRAGNILIVGVEQSGRMYTLFPTDGSKTSKSISKGLGQKLPGAIRLDDSLGEEWVHLVHCQQPFEAAQLKITGPGGIAAPADCRVRSFRIRKA
ncbi:MAG: zf-HC2 domain-containing protein, partial [Deltaproteobacteria bacterium]|nr:zf-HC2 domain-containing protein [Deltaproteobacteria bacterium]